MAVLLWMMGLSLLMQACLGIVEQTNRGCLKWTPKGDNVCCQACHPGNRLVRECGPDPKALCTPCEPKTYTMKQITYECDRCTECVGAQVLMEACTATTDTKCGCREGLTCGDSRCSFCVRTCGKGQEPTLKRSCRTCPDGTFNNQSHQKCKPWSTKCPNPDQTIVEKGTAFTDIKCASVSVEPVTPSKQPVEPVISPKPPVEPVISQTPPVSNPEQAWAWVLSVFPLMAFIIIITIIFVTLKIRKKKLKQEMKKVEITPTLIIGTPTDDPRTLMAVECSFHEAQQEQGRSSESLASKESSEPLIV